MNIEEIINATKAAKDSGLPVEKYADNVLLETTKVVGEGFADMFWLIFSPLKFSRIRVEHNIKKFVKKLDYEIKKIPDEKIVEPPLNVVGPALEASRFYIDDDFVSSMFAKLIASSMNESTQSTAHPAFVEIIKQLSPFDAQTLKYLYENSNSFGVVQLDIISKNNNTKLTSSSTIARNVFPFPDLSLNNSFAYYAAVDNLIRLRIIEIHYDKFYQDSNRYRIISQHPFVKDYCDMFKSESVNMDDGSEFVRIDKKKGIWEFTTLGNNFARCCLE